MANLLFVSFAGLTARSLTSSYLNDFSQPAVFARLLIWKEIPRAVGGRNICYPLFAGIEPALSPYARRFGLVAGDC
jgi:hypothetical protein